MNGKRRPNKRTLHRVHIGTRREDQLWVQAYEQLWPRAKQRSIPPTRSRDRDTPVDPATTVLSVGD